MMKTFVTKINRLLSLKLSNTSNHEKISACNNPYIAARYEWNEMFGDLIKAKYNWQLTAFLSMISNIILIIGFIILASKTRFIPYAVNIDNVGNANFAGILQKDATINPLEINAFIRRFIVNARQIIADPTAQQQAIEFVYAGSTKQALTFMNNYYRTNSPFARAQEYTVEVTIHSVLAKSQNTWQIGWSELKRDLDGNVINTTHWEALVTVTHQAVSDLKVLNLNPLGLFVSQLSWSQQT